MKPPTELEVLHEGLFRKPTELSEYFGANEESLVAIRQRCVA